MRARVRATFAPQLQQLRRSAIAVVIAEVCRFSEKQAYFARGARSGGAACALQSRLSRITEDVMIAIKSSAPIFRGLTVERVAEACRRSAIAFMDGVGRGWEKPDLARWLIGSYHPLSMLRIPTGKALAADAQGGARRERPAERIDGDEVVRVMWEARDEVIRAIESFQREGATSEEFLWRLHGRGTFVAIRDESGARGLVPNETVSQRLAERVLSLVAADYVVHPLDYEERVAICRTCGVMTFRKDARQEQDCGRHRVSGTRRIDLQEMDLEEDGAQSTRRTSS